MAFLLGDDNELHRTFIVPTGKLCHRAYVESLPIYRLIQMLTMRKMRYI